MAPLKRSGTIDLNEDVSFARRQWQAQTACWWLLSFLLLAGFVGACGHGALSTQKDRRASYVLEYQRFDRYQSPSVIKIEILSPPQHSIVRLQRAFTETTEIDRMQPAPTREFLMGSDIVYEFETLATPSIITINFQHKALGLRNNQIQVNGESAYLSQLIFP